MIGKALRNAGLGFLAGLVFFCTHGLYWSYIHPDRDLWDIPILSRDNRVNDWVQVMMIVILIPIGTIAISALLGHAAGASRARKLLPAILAPPVVVLGAFIFGSPALLILFTPVFIYWFMFVGSEEEYLGSLLIGTLACVLALITATALDSPSAFNVALYAVVGWGLVPTVPAIILTFPVHRPRRLDSVPIPILTGYYVAIVLVAFLGTVALNLYFDPPRLTLFATTEAATIDVRGPARQIAGPVGQEIDEGQHNSTFEITGEGPVIFYYALERLGSGTSILGGNDPLDQAAWVLLEQPGTRVSIWFEPGLSVRRVRLEIDRGGDGSVEERRPPDTTSRWNGLDWIGPETRAVIRGCGSNCERLFLTTDQSSWFPEPGVETYYVVFPNRLDPVVFEEPIELTEPVIVWFWSVDADGKVGLVEKARVLTSPSLDTRVEMTPDSAPQKFEIIEPGQEVRIQVSTQKGQRVVLRISDVYSSQPYEFAATVGIDSTPDENPTFGFALRAPGMEQNFTLQNTEHYFISIVPFRVATGGFTVEIYSPEGQ